MARRIKGGIKRRETDQASNQFPKCSPPSGTQRFTLTPWKVMTNLDSIFKSRDITLPTKVRLVEAMVFPVVMYGCESWTIKKVQLML